MREYCETTIPDLPEEESQQPKHLSFGRFYAAFTFVNRKWWEFHVLPFLDISTSRIFAGWLFFAVEFDLRAKGGDK